MSESAMAASASMAAKRASARTRQSQLSSMEALERGFALFRSTFSRDAWRYYVGAVPLVVCSIPIWVLNGQIQISNGGLLAEVALLVAGYLLRVCMVGNYMRHVRERAFGTPISETAGAMARAAGLGRLIAWKIMLSACALVALPSVVGASWFYSGCEFASLEARENGVERRSLGGCMGLSSQWFGGGALLFLMLFPLWIAVWLNCAILAIVLPQLLHAILGVNTLLSTGMGIYALLRSSAFWLSLVAGAWLALDPVVKCTFVIVYQHLRSRREGDDLRGLMASLPREQEKKAQMIGTRTAGSRMNLGVLLAVAAILLGTSVTTPAQAPPNSPPLMQTQDASSTQQARIQGLRQALNDESQRAVYRWHDAEHPSPPNWFDRFLAKIGRGIERAWNAVARFFRRLWPSGLNLSLGSQEHGSWKLKDIRLWLTVVGILTVATGAVLMWLRRRQEPTALSLPQEIAPIPDLNDTAVATQRSEDEWFALASQFEGTGELRFALRAIYFGLLVGLAQRQWLTIRRDRTNREYLNEFTRRWRRRPQWAVAARAEIPEKLRGSLQQFDRVWYGLHSVTPEAVAAYRQDQQEFLNHV